LRNFGGVRFVAKRVFIEHYGNCLVLFAEWPFGGGFWKREFFGAKLAIFFEFQNSGIKISSIGKNVWNFWTGRVRFFAKTQKILQFFSPN
jgi:hypothetical protein